MIAPNKVVELRRNSIVLEHPFEGSTEVPFFVRLESLCQAPGSRGKGLD